MTDVRAMAHDMKLGAFPTWSPKLIARVGEVLDENLDQLELLLSGDIQTLVDDEIRLRKILVAFGAVTADDKVTGSLDILEILLPPVEP